MSLPNKIHAIVNPHAAHGRAGQQWPRILNLFRKRGLSVVARLTKRRWHAYHLTQEAVRSGAHLVISVGGEGTANEVVNGLLQCHGRSPELAMIPIGTGADLSRTLHIPHEHHAIADMIEKGRTRLVDVGKIVFRNGRQRWQRFFINACDAGLGGNVVGIANSALKKLGGFLTFLLSSLTALVTFKPVPMEVWVDGVCVDHGYMTIVGALNGQFFGGGMHAAPMAEIDDGLIECIYVKNTNIFKFVSNVLVKVYTGGHLAYHKVHHYRGKRLRVVGTKTFRVDVDGEEEKTRELVITLMPRALKMRVP